MPSKSRRSRAKHRRLVQQPQKTPTAGITASSPDRTSSTQRASKITGQYKYITDDLRLIGIIAGSMIAFIIILSFIV